MDQTRALALLKEILGLLGAQFDEIEEKSSPGGFAFNIKAKESKLLIGAGGENLAALNHIFKKAVTHADEPVKASVDVNGYLEAANQSLRNKVFILAERARSFKTDVEMEPMTSYERMVAHSFLEPDKELETESVGTGKNRRVVIKYKKQADS